MYEIYVNLRGKYITQFSSSVLQRKQDFKKHAKPVNI